MGDDFYEDGRKALAGRAPRFKLPAFVEKTLSSAEYTTDMGDGSAQIPYVTRRIALPSFSDTPIESPDGQFVSALSSPSVPTCTSRGTGTTAGKLVQVGISATGDDGTSTYNNFYTDRIWFGTSTPAA